MAQIKFVLNRKGVAELLKSEAMESIIVSHAARVANNAGPGYKAAEPHYTGQRVAVNVYPETAEAAQDNLEHNTLLKALH